MSRLNKLYFTTIKIFLIHLAGIIIICLLVFRCEISAEPPGSNGEAPLVWALFLLVDFPLSILTMITSNGADVVTVPAYFAGNPVNGWIFRDVVWPAVVFQFLGTINWLMIVSLYRKFEKRFQTRNGR